MATAGSAVGLGSLWRFPYIIGTNGGGAFVLLYLFFTLFIGIPLFTAEAIIGRSSEKSAVEGYASLVHGQNWRILGWLHVLTAFIVLSYYSVVAGWACNYTLMSFNQFSLGKAPEEIRAIWDLVYRSSGISIFWQAVFLSCTAGVVYGGIQKGIEYWSRKFMPLLFCALFALFLFSTSLPNFREAVFFTLAPKFGEIGPGSILNALGMSFWTLSVGMGIILTYGSYMHANDDIPGTGALIAGISCLISLLAALMIFSVVFSFGFPPASGPGLIFETLPVLFAQMRGTVLLSSAFFSLFLFAALTSSISLLEVLVANLMEVFSWKREKAVFWSALAAFLFGIPSALSGSGRLFPDWQEIYGTNFLETMDYLASSWLMPIGGLFSALFVGWVLEKQMVKGGFFLGTRYRILFSTWYFCIRWLVPLGILLIILQGCGIWSLS